MAMAILELAENLSDEERQTVGTFIEGFITIIEQTAADACERRPPLHPRPGGAPHEHSSRDH